MKQTMRATLAVALLLVSYSPTLYAQSSVGVFDKFAWAENAGFLNWRDAGGTLEGVQIQGTFLSGFAWGENIGWVNFGDGTPANGTNYSTTNAVDHGVNLAANGDLSGFAWGENVGWINFSGATGADRARVDAVANRFRGFVWGENIGWINLEGTLLSVPEFLLCSTDTPSIEFGAAGNATVSSVINVAADQVIDDVKAQVSITHTFVGDLVVDLTSPGATSVRLQETIANLDNDNLYVSYSDDGGPHAAPFDIGSTMVPAGPGVMADFDTAGSLGDWTLDVMDTFPTSAGGVLDFWCLELELSSPQFPQFRRGDVNNDGTVAALTDSLALLNFGFSGGSAPPCFIQADSNGDGTVAALTDTLVLLNFGFSGGPPPPAPGINCGPEPGPPSGLDCLSGTNCP